MHKELKSPPVITLPLLASELPHRVAIVRPRPLLLRASDWLGGRRGTSHWLRGSHGAPHWLGRGAGVGGELFGAVFAIRVCNLMKKHFFFFKNFIL